MRIPMRDGFSIIPKGEYVFRIYEVNHNENFGKIEIKLINAKGQTMTERFTLMQQDGKYNEGALSAFSYFAKTAMNDFDMEDVEPKDLVNHYIRAQVVHSEVPSRKNPDKPMIFANLGDKYPADGFDTEPVERALTLGNENTIQEPVAQEEPQPQTTGLNIDELLG